MTLYANTKECQKPLHPSTFKIHIPKIDYPFTGTGDLFGALLLGLTVQRPQELDWVCAQTTSRLHALLTKTFRQSKGLNPAFLELDLVGAQECLVTNLESFPVISL